MGKIQWIGAWFGTVFLVMGSSSAWGDAAQEPVAEDVKAQRELGRQSAVKKDFEKAVAWFRKAADQGYAPAQNDLGFCYDKGEGVAKDSAEAARWYRKAADQGYALAQFNLAHCYVSGDGVVKDPVEAVRWCRKAADQGCVQAQHSLGICYETGDGGEVYIPDSFDVDKP